MPALEKYRPLRLIGAGGMGEVFLAAQEGPQGFRRVVALKRIRPATDEQQRLLVQHFLDEARLVAKLSHRNVIQIHELGEGPEGLFVAMEFVRGPSVERLLDRLAQRGERMPPALALDVAAQVADGLDYAYSARDEAGEPLRIVHRDVSTQNVLVSITGDVKLIDFGVAKSAAQQRVTTSPVVKGKIAYMSPEQSRAEPLDGRSDLFCLGIVLYEMLAGRHPFLRDNPLSTLKSIEAAQWPRLKEVAPELAACDPLLEKLLARSPEGRFPTGAAASDALALVRQSLPPPPARLGPFVAGPFGKEYEELGRAEATSSPRSATALPPGPGSRPTEEESAPTMLRTPSSKPGGPGAVNLTPLTDSQRREVLALGPTALTPAPQVPNAPRKKWGVAAALLAAAAAGALAVALGLRPSPPPPAAVPPSLVPAVPQPVRVDSPAAGEAPAAPVAPVAAQPAHPRPVPAPLPVPVPDKPSPPPVAAKKPLAVPTPSPAKPSAEPAEPAAVPAPPRYEISVTGAGGTNRVAIGALPGEVVLMEAPLRVQVKAAQDKAVLDCEPWQIVSVDGESIGRSPAVIPGTDRWPLKVGLRSPTSRLEFTLSIRPLGSGK